MRETRRSRDGSLTSLNSDTAAGVTAANLITGIAKKSGQEPQECVPPETGSQT